MKPNKLCRGYLFSLKTALDHTRIMFSKMDGCKPEEVKPFHPDEYLLDPIQWELFND